MKAERLQRYAAKLDHARTRLEQFTEWHVEPDEKSRIASYKAFQEVVEALLDVVAMVLKDAGHVPGADRENLEALERLGVVPPALRAAMWDANRIRNRLVHEYNGLWDDVDLMAAAELTGPVAEALEVMAAWTAKK